MTSRTGGSLLSGRPWGEDGRNGAVVGGEWGKGIINVMHQVLPEKEVSPLTDASQDQLTGKWNRAELGTQLAGRLR